MNKLLAFFGLTVGGWVGWSIGGRHSLMAAFLLGVIGTGIGLYLGHRIARDHY